MLFIPSSLAAACKSFGVPDAIAKSDFDHSKVFSLESALHFKNEVIPYLRNDVLSLKYIVVGFRKVIKDLFKLDLNNFITLSHLASMAWASETPQAGSIILPNRAEYTEWSQAVRGGRVTPQQKKFISSQAATLPYDQLTDFLSMLDCNSLYPFVMRNNRYPTGSYAIISRANDLTTRHLLFSEPLSFSWQNNLFQVDVTCPNDLITAFLPSRDEQGGAVYDLLPKVKQMYYGMELQHAVCDLGYNVTKVHQEWRWLHANRQLPLFADYCDKLYAVRQQHPSGTPLNEVSKLLMNGLYGKMLQKPITRHTSILSAWDGSADLWEGSAADKLVIRYQGADVAFLVTRDDPTYRVKQPFVIGGAILAQSRVHMSKVLLQCEGYHRELCAMLYTDTDSLILPPAAMVNFPPSLLGNALGQFKNDLKGEGKILRFISLAPKTYCLVYMTNDNKLWLKVRCKGIPHRGEPIPVTPLQLSAPHRPELAAQVVPLERWLTKADVERPAVDPRLRIYVITNKEGERAVTDHIPYTAFEDQLEGRLEKIEVYFGSFKVNYSSSTFADSGLSINPMYNKRELDASEWWSKNKRLVREGSIMTFPVGYNLDD